MTGWSRHSGQAVCLLLDNIDTDQLIPARFMSRPRIEGYGDFLLHDLRQGCDGKPDLCFALEQHPTASVLVAGRNFGSGSSREAAVYALVDAGFRAVIAPSFGDIFAANAVNNGLLPARIDDAAMKSLSTCTNHDAFEISINLETGKISSGVLAIPFELDDSWRAKLINGWDDIDLTLTHQADIEHYREHRLPLFSRLQKTTLPPTLIPRIET